MYKLSLGKNCIVRFPYCVKNSGTISIGSKCFIGKYARICSYELTLQTGIVKYKGGNISIGNNFCAQNNLYIFALENVFIGNDVLIGSFVTIIGNDHVIKPGEYPTVEAKTITIGNNVWIAEKAVILKGVTIGDYVVIGAGSIVTHDIPSYCMAVSNPAKVIKKFNFQTKSWEKIDS